MLRICDGKGFQLTFKNGWTVSVQFGPGNYCEGYPDNLLGVDPKDFRDRQREAGAKGSATAEVWRWDLNGDPPEIPREEWHDADYIPREDVRGYQTADEVAAYIAETAAFPLSAPKEDKTA